MSPVHDVWSMFKSLQSAWFFSPHLEVFILMLEYFTLPTLQLSSSESESENLITLAQPLEPGVSDFHCAQVYCFTALV
ncbi:hypothetical protein AMELA_G00198460 [Ameiurus melas]|uniref:Uncharacterized protein n=1 Tax=Ameiurus melas TaxID=219545 RepID=A0A7J6A8Q4_AMEME|nr:hypothetical protein AMELA_G00198460 [Ameiurus melas]